MNHLAIILIFVSSATSYAGPARPDAAALIQLQRDWIARESKGGAAVLSPLLAPDFAGVDVDGKLYSYDDALGLYEGDNLQVYDFKLVNINDSTAVVTYDLIVQTPPAEDQGPPPKYQHVSSVWTRQGGRWRLKFQQATARHWGDW